MTRQEWLESLKAGDKVHNYVTTGRSGDGVEDVITEIHFDASTESKIGLSTKHYHSFIDSFWVEPVLNKA